MLNLKVAQNLKHSQAHSWLVLAVQFLLEKTLRELQEEVVTEEHNTIFIMGISKTLLEIKGVQSTLKNQQLSLIII
jgi:fatty acid/phospholipid biosynthesis enzyme